MKARLTRIGNSRGVRLPKVLIEEVGLDDEVELSVRDGVIIIRPATAPRADWADAARLLVDRGESGMLDAPTLTRFEEDEWEW